IRAVRRSQRSSTRQVREVDVNFDVDVDGDVDVDSDGDLNVVGTFDEVGCFLCATNRHPVSIHRICSAFNVSMSTNVRSSSSRSPSKSSTSCLEDTLSEATN